MSQSYGITPRYLAAYLQGGVAGMLAEAGGAFTVRLMLDDAEISGNGYAANEVRELAGASDVGDGADITLSVAASFTASGGDIAFNQIALYDSANRELVYYGEPFGAELIVSGETYPVNVAFKVGATAQRKNTNTDPLGDLGCKLFAPVLSATAGAALATDQARLAAEGAANAAALNAYFNGGRQRRATGAPKLGDYAIHLASTVDLGVQDRTSIEGSLTTGIYRAEGAFTTASRGGQGSRFVNVAPGLAKMFRLPGFGTFWFGPEVWGNYGRTSDAALAADSASRAAVALSLEGDQSLNYGNGKLQAPAGLTVIAAVEAIKCSAVGSGSSDQINIGGRFMTPLCDVGLHVTNDQSVGHKLDQYEGWLCPLLFYFEKGGKLTVSGQVTCETAGGVMLRTRNIQANGDAFEFDSVYLDSLGAGSSFTVWQQDAPATGEPSAVTKVKIGRLHLAYTNTLGVLFKMNGIYQHLNIQSGSNFRAGAVTVHGGTAAPPNVVRLRGFFFLAGQDPTQYISLAGSSGKADLWIGEGVYVEGSGRVAQQRVYIDL